MDGEAEKARIDIHKELSKNPKMCGFIRVNFLYGKYVNFNVNYSGIPMQPTPAKKDDGKR